MTRKLFIEKIPDKLSAKLICLKINLYFDNLESTFTTDHIVDYLLKKKKLISVVVGKSVSLPFLVKEAINTKQKFWEILISNPEMKAYLLYRVSLDRVERNFMTGIIFHVETNFYLQLHND